MKRIDIVLFTLLFTILFWSVSVFAASTKQESSCLFFTETVEGEGGFSVCDDDSARFLTPFQDWGLQKIGYPISQRYVRDGFVTQAFQKAIMQWRPEANRVVLANIFDDLHNDGFDEQLLITRQTPNQLPAGWDGDISFTKVIEKRQTLLSVRPALHDTYFASNDPLTFYGLPTSEVEDMGNHYAIRTQRAVLQEWKEDVPWAKEGEVTIANGGDIAKELGGLPAEALVPESAPPSTETPSTETPPPTEAPASTEAASTEAPSTEAPPSTEVPPSTEAPSTEAPPSTEVPPSTETPSTEAPPSTEVPQPTVTPQPTEAPPHNTPSGIGGTILLTSNRSGSDECYTMNADGSNVRRLTNFGFCYDGHFTPDGSRIVFTHQEQGQFDIWIMNSDGSNPTNLSNTADRNETFPVVSPDGKKIAYLLTSNTGVELYTMNLDGSDASLITTGSFDLMQAWSPDSQKIAFSSARSGFFNIWIVNVDGTNLKPVTTFEADRAAIWPHFSDNGQELAFLTISEESAWDIWQINLDGTNVRAVAETVVADRLQNPIFAAWQQGRFLIGKGDNQGDWDPYFIAETGDETIRVPASAENDTPTDWLP